MTALSFTATSTRSTDIPGVPLDGLPKLDPGGTLSQAFADLLGQAGKPAPGAPGQHQDATGGSGDPATPPLPAADGKAAANAPATPASSDRPAPGQAGPPSPALATSAAVSGKTLPGEGPDLAAPTGRDEASPQVGGDSARLAPVRTDTSTAPADALGGDAALTDGNAAPESLPEADPDPAKQGMPETRAAPSVEPAADAAARQATMPPPVAIPIAVVASSPRGSSPESPSGHAVAIALGSIVSPVPAPNSAHQPATPAAGPAIAHPLPSAPHQLAAGPEGSADPAAQRGDAQSDLPARGGSARPAEQGARDNVQTGLTLQLRAAEKPLVAPEPGVSSQQAGPATAASPALAVPLAAPIAAAQPVSAGPAAGTMPHFPELAALVDRIAAARDSAGSASATIAIAHKELGNLSLTFETSGRKLDVEVAAQDSETQRILAAAIAADRPQVRVGETAQPSPAQNQPGQNQPGQTATGGQSNGADGMARQTGDGGDARSDRRGGTRSGDHPGAPEGQSRERPKSDGGIYA